MNTGARVGLAVAAGYLLGRSHKLKWALGLAALAGRGRLPGGPGGLVQQGTKLLTSSPEFTKLTGEMKGRLVDAGKAAAVAAVSSKINSLSDSLRERSDLMRAAKPGGNGDAAAGDEEEAEDERSQRDDERYRDEDRADARRRRHRDEDDESGDQAERVPAPRGESDRRDASRQSRHGGEGHGERSGGGARQGQGGGRDRLRSSASRDGGSSE
jgi:hypothetical protein